MHQYVVVLHEEHPPLTPLAFFLLYFGWTPQQCSVYIHIPELDIHKSNIQFGGVLFFNVVAAMTS